MVVIYFLDYYIFLEGTRALFDQLLDALVCVKSVEKLADWAEFFRTNLNLRQTQLVVFIRDLFVDDPQPGVKGEMEFAATVRFRHFNCSYAPERMAAHY